jgi:hypothetical protein
MGTFKVLPRPGSTHSRGKSGTTPHFAAQGCRGVAYCRSEHVPNRLCLIAGRKPSAAEDHPKLLHQHSDNYPVGHLPEIEELDFLCESGRKLWS